MGKAKRNKKKQQKKVTGNRQTRKELKMVSGLTKLKQIYFILFVLVLTFLIYSPILKNEFISYDDRMYVTENPYVKNFNSANAKKLFKEFYWNQYSPVAMSIIGIQFLIDDSPSFNKFLSIVWHLLATILVFQFLKTIFKRPELILIPTLLFAIHPMQVESVAWTAASFKIGPYFLFFLLSLLSYLKYIEQKKWVYLTASLVLFTLSCLSKEQALVLSILLLAIDFIKGRNVLHRRVLLEKIPFLIISIIFGLVTLNASNSAVDTTSFVVDYGFADRFFIANYSVVAYFTKLIVPFNQSAYYLYPIQGAFPVIFYASILINIPLLIGMYFAWKRNSRIILFGLLFFFINIGLTLLMQLLGTRDIMMAERYLYVASIGFFIVFVYILWFLGKKYNISRTVLYSIFALYAIILSFATYERTKTWKDSVTIFSDIIEKETNKKGPQNPALSLAYNEIGVAKKQSGDLKNALVYYNNGLKINPLNHRLYINRGNIYFERKDFKQAIENYSKSIEINEEMNPKAYSSRCAAYGSLGQFDLALANINKAIEQDPLDAAAYKNRSAIFVHTKKLNEALEDANKSQKLAGDDHAVYHLRGEIYREMGDFSNSLQDLNRAIQLSPGSGLYHYSRAMTYEKLGETASAKRDAARAQNLGYKVPDSFLRRIN
jgi:tetratricopeptide (TPR) repeat protein